MKRMSFLLTTPQVRNKTKWVTRRLKCRLKEGERFLAIERGMGLKKGQKQVVLALCEVEAISQIPLKEMTDWDEIVDGKFRFNGDCVLEGFPELSGKQFIEMFCKHMKCSPEQLVYRIQFKYVELHRFDI